MKTIKTILKWAAIIFVAMIAISFINGFIKGCSYGTTGDIEGSTVFSGITTLLIVGSIVLWFFSNKDSKEPDNKKPDE
jgi:uncharacterized membrane protein